ncbi:MAG: 4-hydroxythreonine-4-phosphate dehydrogenase PdxA [Nitrospirae bacterium]|nr:4-hydroxythreonine-4-phosphate dehydrogenase PdxA [Nitrospirota bacterium]
MKKLLAITMGDPAGIGPEVIAKALAGHESECGAIVIGSSEVMKDAVRSLEISLKVRRVSSPSEMNPAPGVIELIDVGGKGPFEKGRPTKEGGLISYLAVKRAVELALEGSVKGIVTAPISKEAIGMAGLKWPGHTEMLAELTGTRDFAMMLVGGKLRVILVTIHASLKSVPGLITKDSVLKTISLAVGACKMLGIEEPRIAVAGLNPHAGEAGRFGDEEEKIISPAISEAMASGIRIGGPYPPDTVFMKAARGDFDIVVAMYHDQGLIPLKLLAFDSGVNMTIGLPFIRTSPDHGTAFDIAWKGKANPSSMTHAISLACGVKVI